ncbi:NFX1-type zinc finger-containing protein 1-like [Myxocyprinus asiaticus]|uniref:NFX1-type zinc finger-containing protein 1-like n=1 Tax=Myxocyprinus asiaticus TaxID=70543 RepID=UPI0022235EA2|nr:NFX1-type zinc finger-containing protein 1-like [Myxocyprinus asiaticus]XP_051562537.1 NFX1-type zinc finger-containing protein 1-like [Myxocyprinus asiaticus]
MFNPRGGGQRRGDFQRRGGGQQRGGVNAQPRRDGSGQRQASGSPNQGRGRGGGHEDRGERGSEGGHGRCRGEWRAEDMSTHLASGSTNGQKERHQWENAQSARGGRRGRGGGDRMGRGERKGIDKHGHHQWGTTSNVLRGPMRSGGPVNASSHQQFKGGLNHGPTHTHFVPVPVNSIYCPEDRSNSQASGSTTDPGVSPQNEEPQRGIGDIQRGRGGHGRGRGRNGTPEVRKLGYKTLEGLLEKEASEVAITLSTSFGLKILLEEKNMRNDLVQLVCQVLCKAFQSRTDRKIVLHLAHLVKDSVFFRNILPYYVTGMMSDYIPARRDQYPQHLSNIISLLSDVLNMLPSSSFQSVTMLVAVLKPTVNQLRDSGLNIPNTIDEDLERIQGLVNHLQEKSREGNLRSDKYSFVAANEDAPPGEEDFRTMSIYPTPEEFHLEQKPFLRPNVMAQSFPNARIYLDTHFRLLREDFVRPLREGIREILYNEDIDGVPIKKRRFDDIRVYFDTQLVVPLCTPTGIAYKVQFDPRPLQFVRWENSKRLIYGSLVCLSMDNFKTFLFATVADRDPKLLTQGQVHLCFSSDSRVHLARVQPSHSFLMVETTAYFEAYRYVLEGLQEQDENDLPFQRYIVECNTEVYAPAYLRMEGRKYDLSNIMAEGQDKIIPFNPLTPEAWPDEETMGLDGSQLQALKLALTNELAIIQGPPGTGKTYVGLKIAQALLDNHQAWAFGSPMLVVCYTNHALDQFLEGISGFLKDGIVRVGGRSNSEILKRFSLRELTRAANFRKNLPQHLRRAHHEIYTQMKDAEEHLKRQSAQLECSLRGVLKEDFLENYISYRHWDSLCQQPVWDGFESVGQKSSMIAEWLCIGSSVFQQGPQQTADGGAEAADDEEAATEEEELLYIDEQADLIQADRILVDAEHWDGNIQKEQMKQERDITALADMMLSMNIDDETQQPQGQIQGQTQGQTDDQGWQMQGHQKKRIKQMVRKELRKTSVMSDEEESHVSDVWNINPKDRWRLYRLWVLRYRTDLRTKALHSEQVFQDAAERLNEIRCREDLCVLRKARVVGMTTTGAAKYRQALQELQPRLVIVEEAAEVLEAHTITTLSRACQHLILIGDHQQLRPSATVYDLAKNFNLEVSMFERLVKVNFPFVRLNYQHRMRPSIARLLTPHIYSELENHPSVLKYDNVKGLLTNLFFVDHPHLEEEIKDGRSHQNLHEANFVVALCRYLLCQDYKPSQITILTTYTGQLHCLRKLMPSTQFSGVKVHVVDKYQGEENDIVILSLVRSNREGRVGFLNISNRVCVALSRAKMGLYCIGNMAMLSKVTLWSNILHCLRENGQVGHALTLSCQNHPEKQSLVSTADDFKCAPEGGCEQPCEYRLECGHVCARMCHPYDADHKEYNCIKNCPKVLCELGHKCPRRCYQKCDPCQVLIVKIIPSCQHKQKVPCHQDPADFVCQERCQKTLTCGHPCKSTCGESCTARCMVKVSMELKCGHMQEEPCYISQDSKKEPNCWTMCGTTLKCGHPCPGTCHGCYQGRLHKGCIYECKRTLVCSHLCQEPCVRDCPPCSLPCENRCIHSVCKKNCGQPCAPCAEPCAWQCAHQRCTKLCHEPCDRPPCSVPCSKTLPCGHPCIGLCGDPCPDKCRVCHPDDVMEIFFGNEDEPDARFIQLEDCKHLFESTGMDTYMVMDEVQGAELDQRAIRLKDCPRCRTPIRRNLRYGAHINRSLAAIEMVKEKIDGVPAVNRHQHETLVLQLDGKTNLRKYLHEEFASLKETLDTNTLSCQQLWHLENLMSFLESFGKLKKMEKENITDTDNILVFSRKVGEGLNFLLDPTQRFSEQQVADLERELKRLFYLADLNARCKTVLSKFHDVVLHAEVQQLREILQDTLPFTAGLEVTVKKMFTKLDTKLPCIGLGITDEERVMILKAIDLNKGHWYKCQNGHVYAIGECGGAMEESKCPECHTAIGGANHSLVHGNAVATEMDGAQHPAWSDAANLANFDLADL